jgi:protein TonB
MAGGTGSGPAIVVAKPKPTGPARISGGVMAGQLESKVTPVYPPIAKAAHVGGTVILRAIISKTGTIENLQAISGPDMLKGAALDAVRQWRYKPYLLNGEPTEVDTTITVNFNLSGG